VHRIRKTGKEAKARKRVVEPNEEEEEEYPILRRRIPTRKVTL
jgi:hypothetical protein